MMKNRKSLFSIAHDHFHGLMLADLIKEGKPSPGQFPGTLEEKAKFSIRFYNIELDNHFYLEEHILQPLVRGINKDIDDMLDEMIDDHNKIRAMVESLKDGTNLSGKLMKLGSYMEEHIRKEERIMFPKVQESLSEQELEELAAKLKHDGYDNIFKL